MQQKIVYAQRHNAAGINLIIYTADMITNNNT